MTEAERPDRQPSELEGGTTDQTWGQGTGEHQPTIENEDVGGEPIASYESGSATDFGDAPPSRQEEGTDR